MELHKARQFSIKGKPLPISYQDMASWAMLTARKIGPFEIGVIRQLDQRYFFVLSNPSIGIPSGKKPTADQVEEGVAAFLRAMRSNKAKPGMVELPQGKPQVQSVPVVQTKSNFGKL